MSRHALFLNIAVLLSVVLCSCSSKINEAEEVNANNNLAFVDSVFTEHLNYLEDVIEGKIIVGGLEGTNKYFSVLDFLESATGIASQREGTFEGLMYIREGDEEEDYNKWKKWYLENRLNLKWDTTEKKIMKKNDINSIAYTTIFSIEF